MRSHDLADSRFLSVITHESTIFVSRHFVEACGQGLGINERLIKEDQQEYHDEMKANYRDLARELSIIMHEQVRASQFTFISVHEEELAHKQCLITLFLITPFSLFLSRT